MEEDGGFRSVKLEDYLGENRSFVSGEGGKRSFEVDYRINGSGVLRASIVFKGGSTGPPGHAHGGATAAVLDESMGIACWFKGIPVVTKRLTVDFIKMVPVGSITELRTEVDDRGEGDVKTRSRLTDVTGEKVYATAEGRYARVPLSRFGNIGMNLEGKIEMTEKRPR